MAEPPPKTSSETDPIGRTEIAPLGGLSLGSVTSAEEAPALVANRYEILGMLGAGAMGTVYRTRDRELDEIVALKVLKKELAAAPGMIERFRREVKLARRVTHKNVARTFDIGDHEGDRFLTMELVEGDMLGTHLARRGRLKVREAVAIGRDVCAGLSAAHAAGVLHRDLKPENVIIARDGRAVITDFGIARALAQVEPGRTAAGAMVGTPAYMAPEQVEGSSDLDERADLYALGTMMFELLTGKEAWPGDSVIAIAAARILRPPPDVRSHMPELPEGVANVVLKLMARFKDDRYSSAEAAGEALTALGAEDYPSARSLMPPSGGTGSGVSDPPVSRVLRKTVAVLPLLNLGADDDAYLAQTLTEDLVDLLCGVPELRVRPRGETLRFDQTRRDVREAGRVLDVDVVVDGSLRRVGDVVRVAVRLITVEDGFQLWARRFDRPPADVLSIADDAASAVARALATERTAEARPPAEDAVAQDLYLRGRYLLHTGWFDVSRKAVQMLREAHERAPQDARIAGTYALAVARVLTAEPDSFEAATAARELAERTLEAHPSQPEARVALGYLHLNNGEGAAGTVQLKRALSTSPNCVEALDVMGRVLVEIGRTDLGFATLRRALAREPQLAHARQALARGIGLLGDLEAARELVGPLSQAEGDLVPQLLLRARFALYHDDRAEADALERDVGLRPQLSERGRRNILAIVQIIRTHSLSSAFAQELQGSLALDARFMPRRLCFHAQMRIECKLGARDIDGALADLRVADANGLLDLLWLDHCPLFEGLRDRPEFVAIHESTTGRADRVLRVLVP